ncbi:hypothetical protein IPG36_03330 [bacterium]|nr:MAG: hypothetical protein IPG36_03330 [bacterium]
MSHPTHQMFVHHKIISRKRLTRSVDGLAYVVGIGGNIAVLPQILKAWQSNAPGLAITTWIAFSLLGLVWLAYAILHNSKPLIVAQVVGISCNLLVVGGWLYQNYWLL